LGVAQLLPSENGSSLIRRADEALYHAKHAGRNCTFWHDGQNILPADSAEKEPVSETCRIPKSRLPEQPQVELKAKRTIPAAAEQGDDSCRDDPPPPRAEQLDRLTDRTSFCQHLRQRIAEWKRGGGTFSVILIGIDGYDESPRVGQPSSSDSILQSVGRFLNGQLRDMDLLARYTPGCYAILLPGARLIEASSVAQRLHQEFGQFAQPGLSLSLGVTEVLEQDEWMPLVERAQTALSAAQSAGGDALCRHCGQTIEAIDSETPTAR
jgi:diguanylate cyclase (GGDEF)-like protein